MRTDEQNKAAAAQLFERMLRRRAARLSAARFVALATWVFDYRKAERLTQRQFAARYRIPVRQIKTYEAVAKWPVEAKDIVRQTPGILVTDLTRQFANRAWASSAALTEGLRTWATSRSRLVVTATDPNVAYLEADLSELLGTPVKVVGDGFSGELRLPFRSPEDFERLLERLRR